MASLFPSASALAPPSRHRVVASCSHPPRRWRLRREPPSSTAWIDCHRCCRTSRAASGPDRSLPDAFSKVFRRTRCWSASRFSIERPAVLPRPSAAAPEQSGPHWDQKVPTAALVWPSSLLQGNHDAVALWLHHPSSCPWCRSARRSPRSRKASKINRRIDEAIGPKSKAKPVSTTTSVPTSDHKLPNLPPISALKMMQKSAKIGTFLVILVV